MPRIGFVNRNLGTAVYYEKNNFNTLIKDANIATKKKGDFEAAIKVDVEQAKKDYTLANAKNATTPSSDSRSKLADAKLRLDKFEEIEKVIKGLQDDEQFVNNVLAFRTRQMSYIKPSLVTKTNGNTPISELPPPPAEMAPIGEAGKTAGKEITIKFIQHAATNQCFIKEYIICDVEDVKNSIGVDESELPDRLVLDTNSQAVTENIQNMNTIMPKKCPDTSSSSSSSSPSSPPPPNVISQSASTSRGRANSINGGYNSTRSATKSRTSMKPRKTSKYSPYDKFMRNTRRNRRRKPFL